MKKLIFLLFAFLLPFLGVEYYSPDPSPEISLEEPNFIPGNILEIPSEVDSDIYFKTIEAPDYTLNDRKPEMIYRLTYRAPDLWSYFPLKHNNFTMEKHRTFILRSSSGNLATAGPLIYLRSPHQRSS